MDLIEFIGRLFIWAVMLITMGCVAILMIVFTVEAIWSFITSTKMGF